MAKKEITSVFKIQAPGGSATPAPPIGPALGQHGVNPGQFIQQFNAATAALRGKVVGCVITVYKDRTFEFEVKAPPVAVMIKDAAGVEKGSGVPHKEKVGSLTLDQVKAIVAEKGAKSSRVTPKKPTAASSRAPPARWASPSKACNRTLIGGRRPSFFMGQPRALNRGRRAGSPGNSKGPFLMPSSKPGKRYTADARVANEDKLPLTQAVERLKGFRATKFDQTVDLVMHLGIDPKQADQMLRGSISLPHGVGGEQKKVIAFCAPEKVDAAKAAGAIEAGGEELVKKIEDGWMDFDVAIAEPAMMRVVSKLGKALGPKGLMPSPKSGTVDPEGRRRRGKAFAAGKVEYRNDAGGNIHCAVGKHSFSAEQLVENAQAMIDHVVKSKPASSKGQYVKGAAISATMTPSVLLEV